MVKRDEENWGWREEKKETRETMRVPKRGKKRRGEARASVVGDNGFNGVAPPPPLDGSAIAEKGVHGLLRLSLLLFSAATRACNPLLSSDGEMSLSFVFFLPDGDEVSDDSNAKEVMTPPALPRFEPNPFYIEDCRFSSQIRDALIDLLSISPKWKFQQGSKRWQGDSEQGLRSMAIVSVQAMAVKS